MPTTPTPVSLGLPASPRARRGRPRRVVAAAARHDALEPVGRPHRAPAEAPPASSPGTSHHAASAEWWRRRQSCEGALTFPSQPFRPAVAHRNFGRRRWRRGQAASRSAAASSSAAARPAQPFAAAFALNARTTRVSHNLILGAAAAPKGDHRSVFARDFGVAHSRQQYVNQDVFGMRVECLPFDANGW